ncbi:hypothetical protein HHI36_000535 [Cryptolaemus montrouzieri]|uniref:Uncharacterized protein n=1 Tax=Cryptolaemus montrouzieri TaxID=559131 RepID=A0ABD2P5X4_9CUCU
MVLYHISQHHQEQVSDHKSVVQYLKFRPKISSVIILQCTKFSFSLDASYFAYFFHVLQLLMCSDPLAIIHHGFSQSTCISDNPQTYIPLFSHQNEDLICDLRLLLHHL